MRVGPETRLVEKLPTPQKQSREFTEIRALQVLSTALLTDILTYVSR